MLQVNNGRATRSRAESLTREDQQGASDSADVTYEVLDSECITEMEVDA